MPDLDRSQQLPAPASAAQQQQPTTTTTTTTTTITAGAAPASVGSGLPNHPPSQPLGHASGRRTHKKSRTGCQTCKARKIKVNNVPLPPASSMTLAKTRAASVTRDTRHALTAYLTAWNAPFSRAPPPPQRLLAIPSPGPSPNPPSRPPPLLLPPPPPPIPTPPRPRRSRNLTSCRSSSSSYSTTSPRGPTPL